MREAKIHFRNQPFMARVDGQGEEPIECTPVVYDTPSTCGVGVLFEDGRGQTWGLLSPRNLIAAWRGTEVLRRLDTSLRAEVMAFARRYGVPLADDPSVGEGGP